MKFVDSTLKEVVFGKVHSEVSKDPASIHGTQSLYVSQMAQECMKEQLILVDRRENSYGY